MQSQGKGCRYGSSHSEARHSSRARQSAAAGWANCKRDKAQAHGVAYPRQAQGEAQLQQGKEKHSESCKARLHWQSAEIGTSVQANSRLLRLLWGSNFTRSIDDCMIWTHTKSLKGSVLLQGSYWLHFSSDSFFKYCQEAVQSNSGRKGWLHYYGIVHCTSIKLKECT